jgi:predicted amidophosphoribosyltransferase
MMGAMQRAAGPSAQPPPANAPATNPAAGAETKSCSVCGKQIASQAKFCSECGSAQS